MIIKGVRRSNGKVAFVTNHPKGDKEKIKFADHELWAYRFDSLNICKAVRDDALETLSNVVILK